MMISCNEITYLRYDFAYIIYARKMFLPEETKKMNR
jgi:hypothetical protein